ncbi:MAG: efflux RND transporter periplasmic adaptor subunit, partial [Gemmatimonadota bacterium]|nr:efflux RND transporter periplasmic adaptor subunit [Gemmatimonadota bacterium]
MTFTDAPVAAGPTKDEDEMNKKRITTLGVGLALLAGGAWFYRRADAKEATVYRFAAVERGNLQSAVSATGALSAVRTVQVGTQVSGQVSAIYVDFNDRVRKGQLLARIDPTLQQQAVQDAQAGLERAQAQLSLAQAEYARNKQLFDAKIVTASEFGAVESNFSVQQANVKSARIALERAQKNLGYTAIYAPIDGVIVERNVDVGQTVAASLSAPQLFLIANDLSQMQILASVSESDIGAIKEGQQVKFTVQPYPNQTFTGTVRQVRLQSTTQDNVVNYTAVVGVGNPEGKLLPGMTATVQFLTGSASDVLTVPNAALRFRPAAGSGTREAGGGTARTAADSARWRARQTAGDSGRADGSRMRGSMGTLWTVDASGKLKAIRVRTGLSDGQKTEVQGRDLTAGTRVIVGTTSGPQS